jgi:hypothetical protein
MSSRGFEPQRERSGVAALLESEDVVIRLGWDVRLIEVALMRVGGES